MNRWFYTKLAWTGIRKNKQLYYPYLIAGMAMVMVFYVFSFLSESEVVRKLPGDSILPIMFHFGALAIGVFSVPFLFYTNSSLLKKRQKEFGLYNILGMNKKNIFTVMFWETLLSFGIVLIGGLLAGIVFSKAAELGLVNIMEKEVNYRIYVEWKSILAAVLVYAVIYFLILLNALHQIHQNNPIELLHSDSQGERPPKSRLFLAVASLILIVSAYYMTSRLEPPMQFSVVFAVAGLITIGTFLLFICASVFLCRILQNNKRYYYKTSHFVTVSTMSFRMKRNGASLAAICILATLILVTLSFSVSFYAGAKDTIERHYPYDIGVSVEIPLEELAQELSSGKYTDSLSSGIEGVVQDSEGIESIEAYSANLMAVITDGCLDLRTDMRDTWFVPGYYDGWERENQKIVYLHVISLEEYNRLCGTSYQLNHEDEVLIASETIDYRSNDIILYRGEKVRVSENLKQVPQMTEVRIDGASLDTHGCEQMFLVVSDLFSFMGKEEGAEYYSEANYLTYHWEYDLTIQEDTAANEIYTAISEKVQSFTQETGNQEINSYLKAEKGERFYALTGGLLFLALIMNLLFLFVTALIMYYKQISEGYEDRKRFEIMRKVGMTKEKIRKSINSQMLTVFSLPLIVAGIHLVFTSRIVYMMLNFSVVDNKPLMLRVMWSCYLFFAVVYTIVYLLTSRTYYKIVNKAE